MDCFCDWCVNDGKIIQQKLFSSWKSFLAVEKLKLTQHLQYKVYFVNYHTLRSKVNWLWEEVVAGAGQRWPRKQLTFDNCCSHFHSFNYIWHVMFKFDSDCFNFSICNLLWWQAFEKGVDHGLAFLHLC